MKKHLICVAAAFGYGPVSKLLTITKYLQILDYELTFIGYGTALELAKSWDFNNIYEYNIHEAQSDNEISEKISNSDGVINVLEPSFGSIAQKVTTMHFYIDSLFWMWGQLDPRVTLSECYFIQNFPGVNKKITDWSDKIQNPVLVNPIVDIKYRTSSKCKKKLIINYGGLESQLITVERGLIYPFIITKLLLPVFESIKLNYEEIIFTGNQKVMAYFEHRYSHKFPYIKFLHLEHDKFLETLSIAKLLVTSPGLTTTYEAFHLKVPVRFLPPQNYSQTLMLDFYRKTNLSDISFHWKDIYPDYKVDFNMEESFAINQILSIIEHFDKDFEAQKNASKILRAVITAPLESRLQFNQFKFATSMGIPAPIKIAKEIDKILSENKK